MISRAMPSSRPARLAARLGQVRSASDVLLLGQIAVLAALVPALMRLPLPRLARLLALADRGPRPRPDAARERHVLALVSLVLDLGRPALRPTCLTWGLTRYVALRQAGAEVDLLFGLGQGPDQQFGGHCWLVRDGQPLLETQDPRLWFAEIFRLPTAPRRW